MAKTIVKHWYGSSNDPSKSTLKEFKTKKDAEKYVKDMRRYHSMQGRERFGAANFYEIYKII